MQPALKRQLLDAASQPYQAAGHIHHQWARSKLGADPVFASLLEQGCLLKCSRVLDLGCGRALLASWFLAAEQLFASAHWRPGFEVPSGISFHGIDLHQGACAAGKRALQPLYGERVSLSCGDLCRADLRGYDAIALLDVLHYIPFAQQDLLLDQIRAALAPGALLLTRVGNAGAGWRFRFSQWVDLAVANAQGHRITSLYCRPLSDWIGALEARGFAVSAQSMSTGTPFANTLLLARVK